MAGNCSTNVKPKTFREFIRSSFFWRPFAGVLAGALLGFLNYYFFGYPSGSSTVAGNPYLSTLMGGAIGYFVLNNPCIRKCQ